MPRTAKKPAAKSKTAAKKSTATKTASKKSTAKSTSILKRKRNRKFEYKRLSASMMKTFLQCKTKWHKHYVLGLPESDSEAFTLGTSVHHALEQANTSLKENMRVLTPFEVSDYVDICRDKLAELHVTDVAVFDIAEQLVTRELETYSIDEKIIGIELEFEVVTPEGIRLYGFIDKITEIDENTIRIVDYKTSRVAITYDQASSDEQLAMYDLVMAMLLPQYNKRVLELNYVRLDKKVKITRDVNDQIAFRKVLVSVDKNIKKFLEEIDLEDKTLEVPASLNQFCSWCSFKGSCDKYQKLLNSSTPAEAIDKTLLTDNEFINEYQRLSFLSKAIETRQAELKIWALKEIEVAPEREISNAEKLMYTVSSTRREPDVVTVLNNIPVEELLGRYTNGDPLVRVKAKALDTHLRAVGDEALKLKIDESTVVKFNAPQIKFKKNPDSN